MTCRIESLGRVVLVVWTEPDATDVARILRAFEKVKQETGLPGIFVSRVPEGSTPPDENLRKAFIANMKALMENCSVMYAVVEGTGFMATVKRSAVSWISLAAGKRKFFSVHARASEIPATLSRDARNEIAEALRFFEAKGLLPLDQPRFGMLKSA